MIQVIFLLLFTWVCVIVLLFTMDVYFFVYFYSIFCLSTPPKKYWLSTLKLIRASTTFSNAKKNQELVCVSVATEKFDLNSWESLVFLRKFYYSSQLSNNYVINFEPFFTWYLFTNSAITINYFHYPPLLIDHLLSSSLGPLSASPMMIAPYWGSIVEDNLMGYMIGQSSPCTKRSGIQFLLIGG